MPIYEYRCESCGKVHSVLQKVSDPAPESCGECNEGPLKKLMSQTSFILKGSGWYVTDFRDGGKKKTAAGDSKGDDKAGTDNTSTEKAVPSEPSKDTKSESSESKSSTATSDSSGKSASS